MLFRESKRDVYDSVSCEVQYSVSLKLGIQKKLNKRVYAWYLYSDSFL
jgi:hypothetical protein